MKMNGMKDGMKGKKGMTYGTSNMGYGGRGMKMEGESVLDQMNKERMMRMKKDMKGRMTGRMSSTGY